MRVGRDSVLRSFLHGRALGAVAAVLAAGGCSFDAGDGGSGGCGGTPGALGQATFNFEPSTDDMSNAAGRAFATGTSVHFSVTLDTGDPLPPVVAETSDATVLAAGPDASVADYPYRAEFRSEGIATLRMRKNADGKVLDQVELRVADPRGMGLSVGGPLTPSFDGGGLIGEPERVALLPGASCRLFAYLTDGTETALYGDFSVAVAGATLVSLADDGMTALSLTGPRIHDAQRVTAGSVEGAETVTLTGPRGLRRTIEFDVTATPDVATLDLYLWPGYVTSFELGTNTWVIAAGRQDDGTPVYGPAIDYASSDPAVVAVQPVSGEPDSAQLDCLALGTATITARLADDPAISATLPVTVVPVSSSH